MDSGELQLLSCQADTFNEDEFRMKNARQLVPNGLFWVFLVSVTWLPVETFARQQEKPFDLFAAPIDNKQIYRHFEETATRMMKDQPADAVNKLQDFLKSAANSANRSLDSLSTSRPSSRGNVYEHMVKSTIYIGELYNCGRCDRTHAGFAGGVMISEDGLALTNYHVMEARNTGSTEGFYAMTWDGRCWPIEEILAASENDDVALIRLNSNDHKFHAAALSDEAPLPMHPVRIISHPYGEFFVMTHGQVSRYSRMRTRRDTSASKPGVWMEVTAPFGSGSSGCGVFNEEGEVIGLVSSIRPLFRNNNRRAAVDQEETDKTKSRYVEMLIRKCVPLSAIRDRFNLESP